ncbi:MAG: WGR domain-containing protein [Pleurocapsa sp. SU_196_0]|nr:WGR domain-containing protein [Pleurocapsa sp. SU_196_0]
MKRYLEFTDGASSKFWEITLKESTITTRYGRLGSNGQQGEKRFETVGKARAAFDKQLREKLAKGYTDPSTTPTASETVYLEHPQSERFFEVSEDNNRMRIRRGEIGKPCLVYEVSWATPNRGRTQLERLVKAWKDAGYAATQPSTSILEGSVAGQLWTDEILQHPRYASFFDLGWAGELRDQRKRLIHFPNGLAYDGDFDLEEIADMGLEAGLIIEGDVRVSGVFSQLTYTYPGSTLILGNIYAHSFGHKDSHLRVKGDVRVENIITASTTMARSRLLGARTGQLGSVPITACWANTGSHAEFL